MYWPLGVPRIYAAAGSHGSHAENGDVEDDQKEKAKKKDASTLLSIRISRSGHLFATISADTLMIWQTLVSEDE